MGMQRLIGLPLRIETALVLALLAATLGCGAGGMASDGSSSLALSLANSTAQVFQGQPSVTVNANLTRSGSTGTVTLTVSGLPQGATDQVQSPGAGSSGSIAFNAGTAAVGTYAVTILASDGTLSTTANLNLTVGASATIMSGTQGTFSVAMSTSFQPAEWDDQFFTLNPSAPTALGNLEPHHIRLQAVSVGVPQGAAGTSSTAWDFATVDAITQPVLGVGDHSPEFQIAKAPPFMYVNNDSSDSFLDLTFQQFAGYAQNLVRYYDTGGFMANGQLYISPAYPAESVTWWGIYNEPNFNNNLTPEQYVTMFNTVVPAMQAIDPAIKIAGLELGDYVGEEGVWVPPFVSAVTAQVDVMATHFYSTCNQKDSDTTVFDSVPGFVTEVEGIYSMMATNPALALVPVWVTENNVNADYDAGNGISACNGTPFVTDLRGSSAFFAAWRPYVFSQLGKAGIRALYHWDYGADPQYGEVDYNTGALQLSYWVDYWLGRLFPASPGSSLLEYSSTDNAELEVLPVVNADKSVVIMVANHAVNDAMTDNNGPGAPRSVLLDVSALGTFSSGSLLLIDAKTSAAGGPTAAPVTPAAQMTVSFGGYGVQFLTLKP
jgi:putative glycosyl hydrolase